MRRSPPPRTADERGDDRPSRPAPRAVVVAEDPAVRDGWARALEATGMDVARCDGPATGCPLTAGLDTCALLDGAGIALYHEALLREPFLSRLAAVRTHAMAIATRDRHRVDGDHEPALSHVVASPTA